MTRAWLGLLMLVAGCQACSGTQTAPAVVSGVDLGVCILTQYATDPQCRPTGQWVQCVGDIATKCGSDAASVAQVLTAHKAALVADGYVAKPDAGP